MPLNFGAIVVIVPERTCGIPISDRGVPKGKPAV